MAFAKEDALQGAEVSAELIERTARGVANTLRDELTALRECLEKSKLCLERATHRAIDAESVITLLQGHVVRLREQIEEAKRR